MNIYTEFTSGQIPKTRTEPNTKTAKRTYNRKLTEDEFLKDCGKTHVKLERYEEMNREITPIFAQKSLIMILNV